jgi:hypothetical protein
MSPGAMSPGGNPASVRQTVIFTQNGRWFLPAGGLSLPAASATAGTWLIRPAAPF